MAVFAEPSRKLAPSGLEPSAVCNHFRRLSRVTAPGYSSYKHRLWPSDAEKFLAIEERETGIQGQGVLPGADEGPPHVGEGFQIW